MRSVAHDSLFSVSRAETATGLSNSLWNSLRSTIKMRIFKCVISNDEMFADSFKITESADGIFYEVEGKSCSRKDDIDDKLIGGNASAEDAVEGTEEATVSGIDIVLNHGLSPTAFDKKSFMVYLKDYVKAIKAYLEENNPGRVEGFVKDSPAAVKRIVADFKNYEFYTGSSMNADGMVGMLNYREDGETPFMIFFKDGVISEKY